MTLICAAAASSLGAVDPPFAMFVLGAAFRPLAEAVSDRPQRHSHAFGGRLNPWTNRLIDDD
jgi:hypothetical protein